MIYDVLVVGGSAGGTAAALAAAEAGVSVCLVEETDWLGGQLTTQGVCTPDEQQHIETFGGTRRYAEFRNQVRQYYREHYRLSAQAQENPLLNPGACWVSRLSYEPKVGAEILWERLRPLEETGNLRILYRTRAVRCEMDAQTGTHIESVTVRGEDGTEQRLTARYVLDATDLGDLLPLCGTEGVDWTVGAESRAETGEPDAPETARPDWVQPFTFPFALEWSPETQADNVITPPEDYAALKAIQKYHIKHGAITGLFFGRAPWWTYRRVLAKENFNDPRIPADLAMINTAGNDYYGGNIIGYTPGSPATGQPLRNEETADVTLARARRASLGYVYWLQTECPREDPETGATLPGRTGYPEFRLRTDLFDTPDGCALRPYIRESRRIVGDYTLTEEDYLTEARFPDAVARNSYPIDIHSTKAKGGLIMKHLPPGHYHEIPYRCLLPVGIENLLVAGRCLSASFAAQAAVRIQQNCRALGEAAGLAAVLALEQGVTPRHIDTDELRQRLNAQGAQI